MLSGRVLLLTTTALFMLFSLATNAFLLPPTFHSTKTPWASFSRWTSYYLGETSKDPNDAHRSKDQVRFQQDENPQEPKLVPVRLAVMSQCPDAQLCESVWDKVLGQVSDKVDMGLIYIGSLNKDAKYGVECMHGDRECAGNIQQLCMHKVFPDIKKWWQFVQCQNFGKTKNIGSDLVAKDCAKSIGIDWEKDGVEKCANGPEGLQLLEDSVNKANELHISKSCSILINWQLVCVHDGAWRNCDDGHDVADFVKQVNDAYDYINRAS